MNAIEQNKQPSIMPPMGYFRHHLPFPVHDVPKSTFALVLLLYNEQKNSRKENYTKHEQQGNCTFAVPSSK
jgi:hypothetical protein